MRGLARGQNWDVLSRPKRTTTYKLWRVCQANKESGSMSTLDVFDIFTRDYARERFETMSLRDWLLAARDDKMLYASPSERMVEALGEPESIDTAQDTRLGRLFFNRTIR